MRDYQRSIHSHVRDQEDGRLRVTSSLLDLEHSFHLDMIVRTEDWEIESASASMDKTPLSRCAAGEAVVRELVGLQIDRGVLRQINNRIGGPRGCAHLAELVTDAVRLLAMIRLGGETGYWGDAHRQRSEEEVIAEGRERLRNSCIVFADE
ncbi:MAG TPA: DUF2889 domain-containing protein [Deferrisomatales bacterium]|nr:DUF2889 domain-containing protein [Deferrisomatales bacterium]